MSAIPDKDDLLTWIRENPAAAGKREIARAFGIRGADRVELKRLLRELEDDGHIEKHNRRVRPAGSLPPVTVLDVLAPDADGDLFAKPNKWEEDGAPPRVLVRPKKGDPALGAGDRILAKIRPVANAEDHAYEARLIKKIAASDRRMLGIYRVSHQGGRLVPVDKRTDREWLIPERDADGASDGELVEAEEVRGRINGLPRGRIVARHGDPGAPRQVSLIAMVQHQIPYAFPEDVQEAAAAEQPLTTLGKREDLRGLPLLTIDPADARDHDDAVCAAPDDDPSNPGGHVVWVAIADVAHHVRAGTVLDREARRRGNSTYFPDRVSPMLPDHLSGDLCSLHEGVDRPCMAVRMVLDSVGNKISHRFTRGLMRSAASLTYEQAQGVADEADVPEVPDFLHGPLRDLFAAYAASAKARNERQPLDLDLPERRVELDDDGTVTAIRLRDRLDAHRLVEEFMILANVCAAETLEEKRTPLLFRVHEEPSQEKLDALRETVETVGLTLAKGQVLKTRHLNTLLHAARESEASEMISMSVLRAQTQAYYAQENFGHFGLNLPRYAHFTSPIRRYADLVVHRALIRALDLGPDGLTDEERAGLSETAEHISQTERRSMTAERDTVDRYLASYLSDSEGAEFDGKISGVAKFGVFVKLAETGADGLVPVSTLGRDYFRYDAQSNTLTGDETGLVLALGLPVRVRLVEATPVTGGLIFEILHVEGAGKLQSRGRGRGSGKGSPRRKLARAKLKKAKDARKAKRKR